MKIADIAQMPTSVVTVPDGCSGVHESTLRAWHIVQRVKDLLSRGVPPDVVLDLIWEMEGEHA